MDHEANVATWQALERNGAKIVWWKMQENGNLHVDDLTPLVSPATRLVACTLASNAIGSIVDVAAAAKVVHAAGAEIFLDSVHFGPHAPIDVQTFDCDYLVCSGYKIFGPHHGISLGTPRTVATLPTFREDFIPDEPPRKVEPGTFIYENVAGMDAAVQYLESLGRTGKEETKRTRLERALASVRAYERTLSMEMLRVLNECGAEVCGIREEDRIQERVPTLCFNLPNIPPARVTEELAKRGIGVRDGHMYAPRLMRRLGLSPETGAVRASLVHYNTLAEVQNFADALAEVYRSHGARPRRRQP